MTTALRSTSLITAEQNMLTHINILYFIKHFINNYNIFHIHVNSPKPHKLSQATPL